MSAGTLSPGQSIGPYEILGLLGAGGMGEVYRARDPRLKREVAIKLLPPSLAGNEERIDRLRREAQVLASIQHPLIATLYAVEEFGAQHALVLELVEGETLAEIMARGPLPADESLSFAKQIAEGLEAAHERGIVHRDLKPANIKVTSAGQVKILDFGLAKALENTPDDVALSSLGTVSRSPTIAGVILGTAAYMSPEQARGKAVDKRTDIWAYGVICYEMLTGRMLFPGDTVTDVLASVLRKDIDLNLLPADTPPALRRVIERCLERDARLRLRDIGEARIALERPEPAAPAAPAAAAPARRIGPWVAVALLGVAILAAFLLITLLPGAANSYQVNLVPSPALKTVETLAVSPDGRFVAVTGLSGKEDATLWVRALDGSMEKEFPGTEGAWLPFWSPDSEWIGYFVEDHLFKINLRNGSLQQLCDVPSPTGGTWNAEGVILVGSWNSALRRCSAGGGEAVQERELEKLETAHEWPSFLPDGKHYLFLADAEQDADHRLRIGVLGSAQTTPLLERIFSGAVYADNSLYYVRKGQLFAQGFDTSKLRLQGDPVALGRPVKWFDRHYYPFSAAAGIVAFHTYDPRSTLTWYDRRGNVLSEVSAQDDYVDVNLSQDDRLLAAEVVDDNRRGDRLVIFDLQRGSTTQFPPQGLRDQYPLWSPDGTELTMVSLLKDDIRLITVPADGASPARTLLHDPNAYPQSWSPDGKYLAVETNLKAGNGADIQILPVDGGKPITIAATTAWENQTQFSRDGKWIVYDAEPDIYAQRFPSDGHRYQVSENGGYCPQWRADGKEIYYLKDNTVQAVAIDTTGGFSASKPVPLFRSSFKNFQNHVPYAVSSDGNRFLVNVDRPDNSLVTLWINPPLPAR